MKILFFADPEGELQKRKKKIIKLVEEFNPDTIAFAGDYFPWAFPYILHYEKYKKNKNFFDLFPELNAWKDFIDEKRIILNYGNKDLKPFIRGLQKKKLSYRNEKLIFTLKKFEEINDFFLINGSYFTRVAPNKFTKSYRKNKILRQFYDYYVFFKKTNEKLEELEEKYGKDSEEYKEAFKEIIEEKKKITPEPLKLMRKYTFTYKNYKELNKLKANSKVLFTHHPPYLKEKEVIFGWKPDRAYIKIKGTFLIPSAPEDKEAKKVDSGDKNIRKFIENNKFRVVFCGHIHEGAGIAKIKKTLIINPGSIAAFQNKKKILPFSFVELKNNKAYVYFNSWTGEFEKEFKKN